MIPSLTILGICGSLQEKSGNLTLINVAAAVAPPGVEVVVLDALRHLPHFNPDVEASGAPESVLRWRRALSDSDAVLIATPEYGFSLPGVLKNGIDWAIGSGELEGKAIAITAAVPAPERGRRGLRALRDTLDAVRATIVGGEPITKGPEHDRRVAELVRALVAAAYTIAPARPGDLPALPAIELAAARLLAGHAPESVLNETTSDDVLATAQRRGHIWVARAGDEPVGFAHVAVVEAGVAHLEEIDVHPRHGRRGLGTRLVEAVCAWAAAAGHRSVTLTTFRDVAWNMPFYARLGFEVIPPEALSPALRAIVEDETRRGLDPARRVAMRRDCSTRDQRPMDSG